MVTNGGIDLDPVMVKMNIKRDGAGMPLPLLKQDPGMMNIAGLSPTILGITQADDLPIVATLELTLMLLFSIGGARWAFMRRRHFLSKV